MATLPTGRRRLFAVFRKIAGSLRRVAFVRSRPAVRCCGGGLCMASTGSTMAGLTTLAARCRSPFGVIGEIARTLLSAGMPGAGRAFTILGEIARIPRLLPLSHQFPLLRAQGAAGFATGPLSTTGRRMSCVHKMSEPVNGGRPHHIPLHDEHRRMNRLQPMRSIQGPNHRPVSLIARPPHRQSCRL